MINRFLAVVFSVACIVIALAVSGFQRQVDIGADVVTAPARGKIEIGRNTPPPTAVDPSTATPSFFDYVRYAIKGGPYYTSTASNDYGIDVDRAGMRVVRGGRSSGPESGGVDPSSVRSAESVRRQVNARNAQRRKTIARNSQSHSGSSFATGGSLGN